jgi:hypothetical protein
MNTIPNYTLVHRSRGSAVGIATGYGFDDRVVGGQKFSLHHVVQTSSGTYPASYPMGSVGFSPGVKRPGGEAHHLPQASAKVKKIPQASAKVKKIWIYTSTLRTPSWRNA